MLDSFDQKTIELSRKVLATRTALDAKNREVAAALKEYEALKEAQEDLELEEATHRAALLKHLSLLS